MIEAKLLLTVTEPGKSLGWGIVSLSKLQVSLPL